MNHWLAFDLKDDVNSGFDLLVEAAMRLSLWCAVGLALILAVPAHAAVFVVTSSSTGGEGTLRDAVDGANAFPGPDSIVFADGLGPIVLVTGQIDVTDTLTILGPPDGQVISADFRSRIFALRSAAATLTLENLILINGRPVDPAVNDPFDCSSASGHGGAVCAEGNLIIRATSLIGNQAFEPPGGGAIFGASSVEVTDSLIENNSAGGFNGGSGGGVSSFGVVSLENSILTNNESSGEGGGVVAFGGLQADRVEISSNSATVGAGGISASEFLTMDSSTISGNMGDFGGIFVMSGSVQIAHSTVVGNVGNFLARQQNLWVNSGSGRAPRA